MRPGPWAACCSCSSAAPHLRAGAEGGPRVRTAAGAGPGQQNSAVQERRRKALTFGRGRAHGPHRAPLLPAGEILDRSPPFFLGHPARPLAPACDWVASPIQSPALVVGQSRSEGQGAAGRGRVLGPRVAAGGRRHVGLPKISGRGMHRAVSENQRPRGFFRGQRGGLVARAALVGAGSGGRPAPAVRRFCGPLVRLREHGQATVPSPARWRFRSCCAGREPFPPRRSRLGGGSGPPQWAQPQRGRRRRRHPGRARGGRVVVAAQERHSDVQVCS